MWLSLLKLFFGDITKKRKKKGLKIAILLVVCSVVLIVGAIIGYTYFLFYSTTGIQNILFKEDEEITQEEETDGWTWTDGEDGVQDGIPEISGGIYPKDPRLANRARLLEVLDESSKSVYEETGIHIEPSYILGALYRETGNSVLNIIDDNLSLNLYKDLYIMNPACGKGNGCNYINNGVSHYVGGTVVNGVDQGNPRTDLFNTDMGSYEKYGPDHALGFLQFEVPYVYSSLNRVYPIGDAELNEDGQQSFTLNTIDSELNFIRPNIFYVPDVIYSCFFRHTRTNYATLSDSHGGPSNYTAVFESDEFKALNERNQSFIRFMYAEADYGRGHVHEQEDDMAYELMRIVNEGKIEYLDEMLMPVASSYYTEYTANGGATMGGNWRSAEEYLRNTYGINIDVGNVAWYGVYAACVGKIAEVNFEKTILAYTDVSDSSNIGAEDGNWLERPGSGKFGNFDNNKYYNEEMQLTMYKQTNLASPWADPSWGGMKLNSGNSTMQSGGCGIYSLAFCASNLKGKEVNPGYSLDLLKDSAGSRIGAYLSTCLHDNGVTYLASELDLKAVTLNYASKTDSAFEQEVIEQLDKGNLILGVWKGSFEWYNGGGHFMVIRGYNPENNYFRVYSSVGASGKSQEQVMGIELPMSTIKANLSNNRSYVWIVGLNQNMS